MSDENGCPNPDCDDPDCLAGKNSPLGKMMNDIFGTMKPKKRVHVDYMSKEECEMFNTMDNLKDQIVKTTAMLETLRSHLWSSIELRLQLYDQKLHINKELCSIEKEVE